MNSAVWEPQQQVQAVHPRAKCLYYFGIRDRIPEEYIAANKMMCESDDG